MQTSAKFDPKRRSTNTLRKLSPLTPDSAPNSSSFFAPLFAPFLALSIFALTTFAPNADAKVFRNAYVSFELPEKWDCSLEQTEWVCRANTPNVDSREAVVILTAKETGPSDALSAYEAHLRTPKMLLARNGQQSPSRVLRVEQRDIGGHPWVDGMHLSSEIPNYYTRYLATIRDRVAVLVTFSAHFTHYTKYSADFFRAIQSLRIVATARDSKSLTGASGGLGGDIIGGTSGMGGFEIGDDGLPPESTNSGDSSNIFIVVVVLAAIGAYLMMKKRKHKGP